MLKYCIGIMNFPVNELLQCSLCVITVQQEVAKSHPLNTTYKRVYLLKKISESHDKKKTNTLNNFSKFHI